MRWMVYAVPKTQEHPKYLTLSQLADIRRNWLFVHTHKKPTHDVIF